MRGRGRTDRAFGEAQLLTDFAGRVALQAQFEDRTFVGVEVAQEALDGLGQQGGLVRPRFAVRRRLPGGGLLAAGRGQFAAGVATPRPGSGQRSATLRSVITVNSPHNPFPVAHV